MVDAVSPTSSTERIGVLDTIRGVAVLGILYMNIVGFGLPNAYEDPTIWGGHEGADLIVWRIAVLFFEGTMRGLFTLLFGAGALLFLERLSERAGDTRAAKLYYRRTLWLLAFGLLNAYVLLWEGDILVFYGIVGLVLFFFRKLSAQKLIAVSALTVTLQVSLALFEYVSYVQLQEDAHAAELAQATGEPFTPAHLAALKALDDKHRNFKPSDEELEDLIDAIRGSYASAAERISDRLTYVYTSYLPQHGFVDSLCLMLLGMALLKLGILRGTAPNATYWRMLIFGYTIGLGVNLHEMLLLERSSFSVEATLTSYLTYDLGRIPLTLGHVAAIVLLCRAPWFARSARALAAVGQTALSNYIAQSVVCLFLFTGAGLAWYGQLQRHELYYIVVVMWAAQTIVSVLWLRHFRFGPLEWLWRSLTYWRLQP